MPQRQRHIADLFFFYLLGEKGKQVLKTALKQDVRVRSDALQEIQEVCVLLRGDENHPIYRSAFSSFSYRMRELRDPQPLLTQDGLRQYLRYMVEQVNPTQQEFQGTYRFLIQEACRLK